MTQGTLVDATLIAAPSSTEKREHAPDPEMHQTKKGNEWPFGMKAHIGMDRCSGLLHAVVSTAANISVVSQTPEALQGQETEPWADADYVYVDKRDDMQTALVKNEQTQTLKLRFSGMCPHYTSFRFSGGPNDYRYAPQHSMERKRRDRRSRAFC